MFFLWPGSTQISPFHVIRPITALQLGVYEVTCDTRSSEGALLLTVFLMCCFIEGSLLLFIDVVAFCPDNSQFVLRCQNDGLIKRGFEPSFLLGYGGLVILMSDEI